MSFQLKIAWLAIKVNPLDIYIFMVQFSCYMKKITVLLFCLALWSCSQKKIDLKDLIVGQKPNIDLSGFTDNIKEQRGRFEMPTENGVQLVDKGEKVVYYYFAGKKNITFYKAKIADVLETKVVTYNGLVSFISVHPDNRDAVSLNYETITY